MAFSIGPISEGSYGLMMSMRGSGTVMVDICVMGVMVPQYSQSTRLNMPGLARAVLMELSSSRTCSIAFSILSSASRSVSSIMSVLSVLLSWVRFAVLARSLRRAHQRADLLPRDRSRDAPPGEEVEHEDRHVVVHTETEGSGVRDLETALEALPVLDGGEQLGVGVGPRVVGVDPVAAPGHEQDSGADLERTLRRGGVRREVRHPHARAEDDHAPLLEVTLRAQRDVRLRDLSHGDRRLHAGGNALLLEEVLEGQAVHHRSEHAHVVAARPVEPALLQLCSAEEIPATDDDRALRAGPGDLRDLAGDGLHHVGVDPDATAAEHLPARLAHHPFVAARLVAHRSPRRGRIEPVSCVVDPGRVPGSRAALPWEPYPFCPIGPVRTPDPGGRVPCAASARGGGTGTHADGGTRVHGCRRRCSSSRSGSGTGPSGLPDLETEEGRDGGAGLGEDVADCLFVLRDGRLVDQHDVLVEAVEAALDDLRQG